MALGPPRNVRFESDSEARLEALASRFGLQSPDLIRLAVAKLLREVERDGRVIFDLNELRVAEGPAAALPAEKGKGGPVSYKAAARAAKKAKAKGHAGESQKG